MIPKPLTGIFIVMMCLLLLMGAENATSWASLYIGKEIVIASNGPDKGFRASPSVAFGRDVFLIAWQEGWHGDGGSSRIHAARIDLNGNILDPEGIEIATSRTGVQENARVAFFNGVFLVVWQDLRNGRDFDVLGARVSTEGKVLDIRPIPIAIAHRTQVMADIASDNKGFLVVWHGFKSDEITSSVFAKRIKMDGSTEKTMIVTHGASPRIAWNGKEHLLAYSTVRRPTPRLAGQTKCWLRLNPDAKALSDAECSWQNTSYAICALPRENGWAMAIPGSPPNYWGRTTGIQKVVRITPEGKWDAPPDDTHYNPKETVPGNWLDTNWRTPEQRKEDKKNKNKEKIWPWRESTLAMNKDHCVVVWERYHIGGATGIALTNADLRVGRVDGWKPLDKLGGIALSQSPASELHPALAGTNAGKLLCVYEKRLEDGTRHICAKTIKTR